MTNRELSQVIRKDLKEHGITSKDVSVRVRDALYDTSVNITIKNPLVRETDVESITRKYSKVDYDQRSMENLFCILLFILHLFHLASQFQWLYLILDRINHHILHPYHVFQHNSHNLRKNNLFLLQAAQ